MKTKVSRAYQQYKEHKEDEGDEVNGPQDPVGLLDPSEVEVSEDNPKLRKSSMGRKTTIRKCSTSSFIHMTAWGC